jgi:hypothetical protein
MCYNFGISVDARRVPMAVGSIPLIEVSGTPRERGRAYGEAARTEIARSLAYYHEAFAASSGLDWPQVLVKARTWRGIVEDAAPHLLEEMDGIAEGAGVTPDDILALNARDGEYRILRGNPCEKRHELLPWNLFDGPGGEAR